MSPIMPTHELEEMRRCAECGEPGPYMVGDRALCARHWHEAETRLAPLGPMVWTAKACIHGVPLAESCSSCVAMTGGYREGYQAPRFVAPPKGGESGTQESEITRAKKITAMGEAELARRKDALWRSAFTNATHMFPLEETWGLERMVEICKRIATQTVQILVEELKW